jgi:hypothetical protein
MDVDEDGGLFEGSSPSSTRGPPWLARDGGLKQNFAAGDRGPIRPRVRFFDHGSTFTPAVRLVATGSNDLAAEVATTADVREELVRRL